MINTAQAMITALKRDQFAGVILYQGPSMLDGSPIVVIANRIDTASNNAKTGAMVQTFIIRSDVDPRAALETGEDASVCGDCKHRPANKGSCYVNVGRSVLSVFRAFLRGRYAVPGVDFDPAILPDLFAGSIFRVGSYGDPTAAPITAWQLVLSKVKAKSGYSHQWLNPAFQGFREFCMASCDTALEAELARSMGWRVFRVRKPGEALMSYEIACPASKEAGVKTNCASCTACGGLTAKAKVNVAIVAHGITAKRFITAE